jgi:L-rhamnose isomerase/sugar isomerase
VFKDIHEARCIFEKIDYAAVVNKYTGICDGVAIHIPWDKCEDYHELTSYAESRGMKIGAVNPNLFQENDYLFGSLCNNVEAMRAKAINHCKECVDIAKLTGSRDISLWVADGTNYPGQADFRTRKHLLEDSLAQIYSYMPQTMRLLIEYKTFEPAFYQTDIADWGMSMNFANKLGENAKVLIDLGHHFQGANIEQLVAFILDEGKMGGFHFNNRKYADDDLIVGTINPYELFLVFCELTKAEDDPSTSGCTKDIAYMIDQSHNIEPKIPAMIRSVLNVQTAHAKALMLDRESLKKAQDENDVLGAEAIVKQAFETDMTPLLESIRDEMNLAPDPMKAYLNSEDHKKMMKEDKTNESSRT